MRFLARRHTSGSQGGKPAGRCRQIRQRLAESMLQRVGPQAPWVQQHVAHCPRCQKRLAALGKVDLALSFIKSQPQRLDLLTRANAAAVRMLNHSLREAAETTKLEETKSPSELIERYSWYRNPVMNLAACLVILLLTKAGIFSSFDHVHSRGEAALRQYYATQAGEDVAREIFGS